MSKCLDERIIGKLEKLSKKKNLNFEDIVCEYFVKYDKFLEIRELYGLNRNETKVVTYFFLKNKYDKIK